jgi:long-chain acyl-CoA synthetase
MEGKNTTYPVRAIAHLKEMIQESARLYGDNTAFLVKDEKGGAYREITYGKFQEDIDALGTMMMEMGLKDKKIAIIGENCYPWMVAYYATVNGVGVAVPLDKELNENEIHNLMNTATCDAVFFTEAYSHYFNEFPVKYKIQMKAYEKEPDQETQGILFKDWVENGKTLLDGGNTSFQEREIDPHEMKMILFTSGTTDIAKGVMLNHHNIVSNIMDGSRIVKVHETDRTLSILPIHHTFESTMGTGMILYAGASIAFCEGLKYIAKNMEEAKVSILVGVPLIFESIYDKIWKQAEKTGKAKTLRKAIQWNKSLKGMGLDMSRRLFKAVHKKFGGNLRMIVSGAAPIDPNVIRGFEDLGLKVLQGYGLTECSPLISGTPDFSDTYKKAGSVGLCVHSGAIQIVDQDEDQIGEILYAGPNVMMGYYNLPEKTEEVLKDGWFHTGDLGFLDDNGWLYITGRKKNVIVTKTGKNIYPEEVEYYINRNKYIQESLVHGILDDNEDTLVSAQVRPDYDVIYEEFGENMDEGQIHALIKKVMGEINEKLPIYKRVRNFSVRREEFIKTTTKKIKRYQNK